MFHLLIYMDLSYFYFPFIFLNILSYFYISIKSFIFSYLLSPIPFTFFISSLVLNFPFSFLYCIIFSAVDTPIPGNVCNCSLVAVFIFIFELFDLVKLLIFEVFVSLVLYLAWVIVSFWLTTTLFSFSSISFLVGI